MAYSSRRRGRSARRCFTSLGTLVTSAAITVRFVEPAAAAPMQAQQPPTPPVTRPRHDLPVIRFDIPAAPLGTALSAFERASGIVVHVSDDAIRSLVSPGVTGVMTADAALLQLLAGTRVRHRFLSQSAIALELRATDERVDVSAPVVAAASPKYTAPLRDTPQTITVIPSTVIAAQGATTLRDVLRNVSGITFQAGEGGAPAGDQMTIRGFSARTDFFVDGVRDFGGYSRDPFNLEQLEVAKGPSSAISGRGTTGGAVNQVSKAPNLATLRDVGVSFGNADAKRTTVDLNQPLAGVGLGRAAVRLNAMWTDGGVPGRDHVNSERWGVAPSIAFGLATPTRVTLAYQRLSQDNLGEYGLPWVPANTNPDLAAYANGAAPVDPSNFYGLLDRDYEKTTTDLATATIERDVAATATLRNLTRFGRTDRDSVITAPRFASVNTNTAINRQLQSRDMRDGIVANQTTLTAHFNTGAVAHSIAAGVDVAHESSVNYGRSGPAAPQADLYNPDATAPYAGPITRTGAKTDGRANSVAAYIFDTARVYPKLELTGGVRFDRFDVDTEATAVAGTITAFSRQDRMTSWRAGAVYKPRPAGSLYVGYGTSANPSAEGLSLSATTVDLAPERTRSIEAGSKWDLAGGRASVNVALFRTEKLNARTPGVNAGDPPTVLAGRQRVDGIELGVAGRPAAWWDLLATAAFMRSDIVASNTPTEVDNALALAPKTTFSLWSMFELPRHVSVGGGAQFMDSVFRNATNTAKVPSYWLINAVASYPLNSHLTLRVNANNLADAQYIDRVGGGHYIPGPRRQVTFGAQVGF